LSNAYQLADGPAFQLAQKPELSDFLGFIRDHPRESAVRNFAITVIC
jgi:hypothetical protein